MSCWGSCPPLRESHCVASGSRWPVVGEPPAVRSKVVKPEEPMDWSQEGMSSGGAVARDRVTPRASATRACGFSAGASL